MHDKLLIVDRELVHIGGANVQHFNDWGPGQIPWHDGAFILRGEIAHALLLHFAGLWSEGYELCTRRSCDRDPPTGRFDLGTPIANENCTPMLALTRKARGGFNNANNTPQSLGFLAAFNGAQKIIRLQSPNLNDDRVVEALIEAAVERRVRLRLLLSRGFNAGAENLPTLGGDNVSTAREMFSRIRARIGSAACDHFDFRWYVDPRRGLVDGRAQGASHLKYTSFDGQLAIVGNANMDEQAFNHSSEANVAIDDPHVARRYDADVFDPAFARGHPSEHCSAREPPQEDCLALTCSDCLESGGCTWCPTANFCSDRAACEGDPVDAADACPPCSDHNPLAQPDSFKRECTADTRCAWSQECYRCLSAEESDDSSACGAVFGRDGDPCDPERAGCGH